MRSNRSFFVIERSKDQKDLEKNRIDLFKDRKDRKIEDQKIEFPTLIFLGPSALCSTYVVHRLKDYIY